MITALCLLLSASMAVTPPPGAELVARMILTEAVQDRETNRSSGNKYHGQCKRFQVNTFAEVSGDFMLASYPNAELFMPLEHASKESTGGRVVGTAWEIVLPEDGNAYVEVARYDYDGSMTKQENLETARAFLRNVQAGDQLQMMARYNSGTRGTHSLMFTRAYDPRSEYLYWADSNFSNTMIDGIRYGNVRAYQEWKLEDVAGWLAADGNNGATLYRLSEDIVRRGE